MTDRDRWPGLFLSPGISSMLDSIEAMRAQHAQAERAFDPMALRKDAAMLGIDRSSSVFGALIGDLENRTGFYQTYLEQARQAARPAWLAAFERQQGQLLSTVAAIQTAAGSAWSIPRDLELIRSSAALLTAPTSLAALAVGIDGCEAFLNSRTSPFAAQLRSTTEAATRALAESSEILARCEGMATMAAVERSILLGSAALGAGADLLRRLGTIEATPESDPPPRLLLGLQHQRLELLALTEEVDDYGLDELAVATPAGRVLMVSREILTLVTEVNEQAVVEGRTPLISLTTRLLRVYAELPFAVAMDRDSFAEFIDDLYWLLYEGAGSDSLRYLSGNGGGLEVGDCGIVFAIKRLRNYYRHDQEHGSPRDVERKMKAVCTDLSALGQVGLPRTRDEYSALQRVILAEVAVFLKKVAARGAKDKA